MRLVWLEPREREEKGSQTEKQGQVLWAWGPTQTCGFYLKSERKSLENVKQGRDMTYLDS